MSFRKIVLKNGLRCVLVPMESNQTVTVMVLVGAGSLYETKKENGISHFLEHMCFKGTKSWPTSADLAFEFDKLGSAHNAFTGGSTTGYWAKAHHEKAEKILDLVSDLYMRPLLPEVEIEKEKGVIIEEIKRANDNPQRVLWRALDTLLYGNQPAGWTVLGPQENIAKMNVKKIRAYRDKHYIPHNTVVVIAGRFDTTRIEKKIISLFVDSNQKQEEVKVKKNTLIPKPHSTRIQQKSPQIKIVYKKTEQTKITLAFRAYNKYDKRRYATALLAVILGKGMSSRLWRVMREEKGICYSIGASVNSAHDHGEFVFHSGVAHKRVGEALSGILQEVTKIAKEDVSEEELVKAKDFLLGGMFLSLESSDEFADFYGFQELDGEPLMTPEELEKAFKSVTAQEIKTVALDIFKTKHINCVIYGPHRDVTKFKKLLSLEHE